MKITLNLATRPYADQGPAIKRLRVGMAVLVVILAGLGWGLMHFHQSALKMKAQEDAVNQEIAKIRQEQLGYEAQMQQPANARVLQQAEFLNGLFDEKSFSWTAAMEDLERVLPTGVQVTAIEPSRGKDGRITLRLRVSGDRERSVEMVRNMEHSRRFVSPRIAVENAENPAQGNLQQVRGAIGASNKVSFDVLAEYNPASLAERKLEIGAQKRGHAGTSTGARTQARPRAGGAGRNPAAPTSPMSPASRPGYIPPNQATPQGGRPGMQPGAQPGAPPMANRFQPPASQPPAQPYTQPGGPK
jgi:type IV pilus assembly protein PilN